MKINNTFILSIKIAIVVLVLVLSSYWYLDPQGNYEPIIVGLSTVLAITEIYRRYNAGTLDIASGINFKLESVKNRNEFIYIDNEYLKVAKIDSNTSSSQWTLEQVGKSDYYRIKSSVYENMYIHYQHGQIDVGEIKSGWYKSHWKFEGISNNKYRICSRFKGDGAVYINNENKNIDATQINKDLKSVTWYLRVV